MDRWEGVDFYLSCTFQLSELTLKLDRVDITFSSGCGGSADVYCVFLVPRGYSKILWYSIAHQSPLSISIQSFSRFRTQQPTGTHETCKGLAATRGSIEPLRCAPHPLPSWLWVHERTRFCFPKQKNYLRFPRGSGFLGYSLSSMLQVHPGASNHHLSDAWDPFARYDYCEIRHPPPESWCEGYSSKKLFEGTADDNDSGHTPASLPLDLCDALLSSPDLCESPQSRSSCTSSVSSGNSSGSASSYNSYIGALLARRFCKLYHQHIAERAAQPSQRPEQVSVYSPLYLGQSLGLAKGGSSSAAFTRPIFDPLSKTRGFIPFHSTLMTRGKAAVAAAKIQPSLERFFALMTKKNERTSRSDGSNDAAPADAAASNGTASGTSTDPMDVDFGYGRFASAAPGTDAPPEYTSEWHEALEEYFPAMNTTHALFGLRKIDSVIGAQDAGDASLLGMRIYSPCVSLANPGIAKEFNPQNYDHLSDLRMKDDIPEEEQQRLVEQLATITFEPSCVGMAVPGDTLREDGTDAVLLADEQQPFVDYTYVYMSAGKYYPMTEEMVRVVVTEPVLARLNSRQLALGIEELKKIRILRRPICGKPPRKFPLLPPSAEIDPDVISKLKTNLAYRDSLVRESINTHVDRHIACQLLEQQQQQRDLRNAQAAAESAAAAALNPPPPHHAKRTKPKRKRPSRTIRRSLVSSAFEAALSASTVVSVNEHTAPSSSPPPPPPPLPPPSASMSSATTGRRLQPAQRAPPKASVEVDDDEDEFLEGLSSNADLLKAVNMFETQADANADTAEIQSDNEDQYDDDPEEEDAGDGEEDDEDAEDIRESGDEDVSGDETGVHSDGSDSYNDEDMARDDGSASEEEDEKSKSGDTEEELLMSVTKNSKTTPKKPPPARKRPARNPYVDDMADASDADSEDDEEDATSFGSIAAQDSIDEYDTNDGFINDGELEYEDDDDDLSPAPRKKSSNRRAPTKAAKTEAEPVSRPAARTTASAVTTPAVRAKKRVIQEDEDDFDEPASLDNLKPVGGPRSTAAEKIDAATRTAALISVGNGRDAKTASAPKKSRAPSGGKARAQISSQIDESISSAMETATAAPAAALASDKVKDPAPKTRSHAKKPAANSVPPADVQAQQKHSGTKASSAITGKKRPRSSADDETLSEDAVPTKRPATSVPDDKKTSANTTKAPASSKKPSKPHAPVSSKQIQPAESVQEASMVVDAAVVPPTKSKSSASSSSSSSSSSSKKNRKPDVTTKCEAVKLGAAGKYFLPTTKTEGIIACEASPATAAACLGITNVLENYYCRTQDPLEKPIPKPPAAEMPGVIFSGLRYFATAINRMNINYDGFGKTDDIRRIAQFFDMLPDGVARNMPATSSFEDIRL